MHNIDVCYGDDDEYDDDRSLKSEHIDWTPDMVNTAMNRIAIEQQSVESLLTERLALSKRQQTRLASPSSPEVERDKAKKLVHVHPSVYDDGVWSPPPVLPATRISAMRRKST